MCCNAQSGFPENHSCESVIINVCDDWCTEMEGNSVVAPNLNLGRAFKTIDRRLLMKLRANGVEGIVQKWLASYLSCQYQQVKYKNEIPVSLLTEHVVPQGAVLGPLLFCICINDIVL